MTAIEDFKNALRAGNFEEAFVSLLSKAIDFSITTWAVSDERDLVESKAMNPSKAGNSLRTRINLLEGEIHHEIDQTFLENGFSQELQQFHLEQVAKGNEIIEKNLESVEKLIQLLAAFKQQKSELEDAKLDSLPIVNEILTETEDRAKIVSKKTSLISKMTFVSAMNIEDESESGSFKLQIEDIVETEAPAESLTEVVPDSSEAVSVLDLDFSENTSTIETDEEWTDIFEEFETLENLEVAETTDEGEPDFQAELEPSTIVAQEEAEAEWDGWTIEELEEDAPNNKTAPTLDFNTAFEEEFEAWIETDVEPVSQIPEFATEGV